MDQAGFIYKNAYNEFYRGGIPTGTAATTRQRFSGCGVAATDSRMPR